MTDLEQVASAVDDLARVLREQMQDIGCEVEALADYMAKPSAEAMTDELNTLIDHWRAGQHCNGVALTVAQEQLAKLQSAFGDKPTLAGIWRRGVEEIGARVLHEIAETACVAEMGAEA